MRSFRIVSLDCSLLFAAVIKFVLVVGALVYAVQSHSSKPACRMEYGSPLLDAVANRDIPMVTDLLMKGSDPNMSVGGTYPLLLSVHGSSTNCNTPPPDPQLFRMLVNAGADVNRITSQGGGSFIFLGAATGKVEILRLALEFGANVNTRALDGNTPLIVAARNTHVDAVELLLRANADVNAVYHDSRFTALHFAARNPGAENKLAKLLVAHGATYQINGRVGPFFEFSRFYREERGNIDELIDLLVSAGGAINEVAHADNQMLSSLQTARHPPQTPLNVGLTSTHAPREVFEAMLKKGADPNMGALYALAIREDFSNVSLKRKDLLELLFQYGARVERTPQFTSLSIVASANRINPIYARELMEIIERYVQ